jgi:hypothetical protein
MRRAKDQLGFSLVEVSLAIFIVSFGLLTLFTLFPKGLKQAEAGHADTQTALFSDYVLSTLRANAMGVDSEIWDALEFSDIWPATDSTARPDLESLQAVEFPVGSELYIRYFLELNPRGDHYAVALWVQAGQYGSSDVNTFKRSADAYYTELFYSGMP